VASIVAHELTPEGVRVRTLLDGARLDVSSAGWVPGSGDEQVALVLHLVALRDRQRLDGGRAILRWRWGPDAAEVRPIAGNGSFSPAWLLTSQGVFIEAENRSAPVETLELRSYPPGDGAMEATALTAPRRQSGPHGFGERRDGSLWLHWGERLALLGPGKPPRRLDLEPLLERGTEWADVAVYVAEPESIWFGLDGRQRGYSRVDLAEAERRSSEWR
jgi:hypothetical protein